MVEASQPIVSVQGGMFDNQKLDFGLSIAERGCGYGPFVPWC